MSTTFDDIPDGMAVYLDANVFISDWNGRSKACTCLVERCRQEQLYGLCSTVTMAEVCHRTMCHEAVKAKPDLINHLKSRTKKLVDYLKKHPDFVRNLREYLDLMEDLLAQSNLEILPVAEEEIQRSAAIRERYGLLTNDSIIAQIVLDYGIPALATNDGDFERVEGIHVYKPGDI